MARCRSGQSFEPEPGVVARKRNAFGCAPGREWMNAMSRDESSYGLLNQG
jgi:hypothetical protein